jgi:SAM-dependent methyltransferase
MKDDNRGSVTDRYDRIAEEYSRNLFRELERKPLDRELLSRFAAATAGRGSVCDMGCGPGQVARFLKDAGADVFGLDGSAGMIAQAQRLNPDIEFRQDDMLALTLADDSLAGIAAFYAIVNIQRGSLPQVFREMHRVLQPGGLLLLAFHTGREVVQVEEMWGRRVSLDFYFYEPDEIRKLLGEAGLTVEETVERGPYAPEVEHQSRRAYIFARRG